MTATTPRPSRWTPLMPVLALACAGITMGGATGCTSSWNALDHERSRTSRMEIRAQPTLRVTGEVGDLKIVGSPDTNRITALVELVGKGPGPEEAQSRLDELRAVLLAQDGVVFASTEHPEVSGPYPYAANWSITCPVGTRVEVRNDVGDVVVYATDAPVDITNDVGDVWIADATDALVRCDVGDVTVDAAGGLDVANDVGDVRARSIDPDADHTVRSDVGDVLVVLPAEWTGAFAASTDTGDVRINGAEERRPSRDALARGNASTPTLLARTDVGDVTIVTTGDAGLLPAQPAIDVPGEKKETEVGAGSQSKAID